MRVAIIPARGGSKGVFRKNVRLVAGKPLIAWCIQAALSSKQVDQVYVSTDDDEIADISKKFGAKVIQRPVDISGDTASSESAIYHALCCLHENNLFPDEIVFLQCTSPLTTAADIDACIDKLNVEHADTAFTAKQFYYFVWKVNADGSAVGLNHDKAVRQRRQDREQQFEENGAVYVMKTIGFMKYRHRFFGKTVVSVMPEDRSFEIDSETDLEIASTLLINNAVQHNCRTLPLRIDAIVFDFDGVMTDDAVWVSTDGVESVRCSREDGQGVARAKKWGIPMLILSTEENLVVSARARKMKMDVIQNAGLTTKVAVLKDWVSSHGMLAENIIYMGNDLNDLECMRYCGFAVAPKSANATVKAMSDLVLNRNGGNGAVRELLEYVANERGFSF